MNNNIDQLKTEVNDIKNSLNELKDNVSLSESEKKEKAEKLKSQAETTKQRIQAEIDLLSDKTDDESKKNKEEAEALLGSLAETLSLYESIVNVPSTTEQPEDESKGITGWIGDQWNDVWDGDKWEKETGKNLLRTVGFAATGVGAVALAVKGIKKLVEKRKKKKEKKSSNKESKDKKDEKKSWWKKFLIGTGITAGTVIGGVQIYKHRNKISSWFKEKLGLALSFEESMQKVENEVRNGKIDDDHFGAFNSNFENGITFDEQTQEICSYDQKTKIDKKNKKLEGLDVEFPSYEELIHAANIVNFAKRKLRGRGATSTPFMKTEWGGDIAFNCSANGKKEFLSANNSNEWSWILGTIGTVGGGILGGYCAGVKGAAIGGLTGGTGGYALGAYIDNTSAAGRCCKTIARGKNFDLFINYLNSQTDENGKSLWESAGEQHINPDETPINGLVDNGAENMGEWEGVLAEIEKEYGEDQTGRRNLNIIWDESNHTEYTVESFGHRTKLTIEGGPTKKGDSIDYSKITKIHIEMYDENDWGDGLDIDFPKTEAGLKEAIKVVNLTNMIREDRAKKGGESYPFAYGKYKAPFSFEIDAAGIGTNYMGGTTILNHDTLKDKYPTLYKDLRKFPSTASAVQQAEKFQKKMNKQAVDDETTGSQYIKFLHQMGRGRYWKAS